MTRTYSEKVGGKWRSIRSHAVCDDCAAHRDAQAREEPFIEGLRAGRLGLSPSLNPYSPGEIGFAEWERGRHSALLMNAHPSLTREFAEVYLNGQQDGINGDKFRLDATKLARAA